MRYLFWTLIGILLLAQLIAYALWRIAFRSPNRRQNDDYHLADTEQFRPLQKTITGMIDRLFDHCFGAQYPERNKCQGQKAQGRSRYGRRYYNTGGLP